MGSIPPELSLDCTFAYVPRTITDFLREVSRIGNAYEKKMKIDDYVRKLEDEMKKIDAFNRELPLCVLLVKDAIVALRKESNQYRKSDVKPVLEEFISLNKSCHDDDDKVKIAAEKDSREKMNWMSSVQLWNSDLKCTNTDVANNKRSSKSELKMRSTDEVKRLVANDPFQSCKTKNIQQAFSPFRGYSVIPVALVRSEDKDELAGVPRLSLRTPGVKSLREDTATSGLSSKADNSRGGSSNVATCQLNIRTGSLAELQQNARKQRRCWSPELHRQFVEALHQLGGSQVATPKQIRELMHVDGLTNDEVKSHLQKYRMHTRRLPNTQTPSANQSVIQLGNLWMSHGEPSKLSSSQSGSPQGPLQLGGSSRGTSMTGGDSTEEEDDEKFESQLEKSRSYVGEN